MTRYGYVTAAPDVSQAEQFLLLLDLLALIVADAGEAQWTQSQELYTCTLGILRVAMN